MGFSEPLIREDLDPSTVTFRMCFSRKGMTLRDSILSLIRSDDHITVSELSKRLSVSRSTVQRELDSMKADGVVKRIGGTRGYWLLEEAEKDLDE